MIVVAGLKTKVYRNPKQILQMSIYLTQARPFEYYPVCIYRRMGYMWKAKITTLIDCAKKTSAA